MSFDRKRTTSSSDVRATAREALTRLLTPLTAFVFDAGLSVKDFRQILISAAVRNVASRQLEVSRRVNISGISASTGIPRAEVSKILKSGAKSEKKHFESHQQSTNRILSAWHRDPKFTTPNGQPADLKVYGRGPTFETLVKLYGKGIPTRALLDELARLRAIEMQGAQVVRVKTIVPVDVGYTPQIVSAFGDRVTELISTLLHNMRNPEKAQFIASFADARVDASVLPLFRREILHKGAELIDEVQDMLANQPLRSQPTPVRSGTSSVSVTIYLHEQQNKRKYKKVKEVESVPRRKNFRRNS